MEWVTPEMIGSVGFPIVVASYLLVRMEKIVVGLTESVRENTAMIKLFMERVK